MTLLTVFITSLSAFAYEGNEIIVGVFGCPEVDDRFGDTLQLFVGGYVIKYGQPDAAQ